MAAKGKGQDYYQSTYTHQQLWDMLHEGDDYSVERAGSIWVSASSGMKAAREEMDTHVTSLRTQWTGAASDEFEGRMNLVKQYSVESETGMQTAGEFDIPAWLLHSRTHRRIPKPSTLRTLTSTRTGSRALKTSTPPVLRRSQKKPSGSRNTRPT